MSSVKLVGLTKPSAETGCHTVEDLVAYAARVSNPGNQNNNESAPRLLRYLMKHQHWSPFEMVHITLEIQTTRDIARQILRHRSFSFQEFSQRYAEATGFQTREARIQDVKNRQNSIEITEAEGAIGREFKETWNMKQETILHKVKEVYNWALEHGMAKEQARAILPEGLTQSTMYMAGSLRSWIHYCQLRAGPETQKEHRIIAQQCWDVISQHFPSIAGLLDESDI